MNDILPSDVATWQFVETTARCIFNAFGFNEIRVPVVEKTELFCRSIGETTDIVEKEMYTFTDRSDNSLTLRPEGTAPVMRSMIQHRLINQDPIQKLYYSGPMFRYERPQKGRYRQFHQIGAEVVGVDDPLIDAQVLAMLDHFFKQIGIHDVTLEINSLGCPECRPGYRDALTDFLEQRLESLCTDCQRRFRENPLRALDCKVPGCQKATEGAPVVLDHLCSGCDDHFTQVRVHLEDVEVDYNINPRMVRGLDYYTKTTFEMITGSLGSQNAVAAGGRYDGLVQKLGGPKVPGIGFAMGVERLVLLLAELELSNASPDLFIAALGKDAQKIGFKLLTFLQREGIRSEMDYSDKSLKSQMKRADKLGARYSLILGDDELQKGIAPLRNMTDGDQTDVKIQDNDRILTTIRQTKTP
jgi:histidyl-tRNA synthetase